MARRTMFLCATLAVAVLVMACGGGKSTPTSPTNTAPPAATGSNALTIAIQSSSGAQAFSPNPAAVGQGQAVAWRNSDSVTHHIVANDGSFDTGDIAPGGTSAQRTFAAGVNYHCTLHTNMVGAIGVAAAPPPDCTGPYC
jgi:plastocyanin